eukprot:GHVQ01033058.1.p1 GENE.GHVQ01033058.1~~GHVQ01033058.1.p1  ORF type:complete len:365 (+),score=48.26 GHVQ01033058.1:93-1187(+)
MFTMKIEGLCRSSQFGRRALHVVYATCSAVVLMSLIPAVCGFALGGRGSSLGTLPLSFPKCFPCSHTGRCISRGASVTSVPLSPVSPLDGLSVNSAGSASLLQAAAAASAAAALKTAPVMTQESIEDSTKHNIFSKGLRGLLRGHKCLFDDSKLPNGDMVFLLRGADSSQRYVYPLELQTNHAHLPGAAAAKIMFEKKDEAIQFTRDYVFGKEGNGTNLGLRRDDAGVGEIVSEEIARFHRVLQYGVAAQMTSFMRPEVMEYNAELYSEMGVDVDILIGSMDSMKNFYSEYIRGDQWNQVFEPAIGSVVDVLVHIKQTLANRNGGVSGRGQQHEEVPTTWEAAADPRTMTPLLVAFETTQAAQT